MKQALWKLLSKEVNQSFTMPKKSLQESSNMVKSENEAKLKPEFRRFQRSITCPC
jgi:hypothetical protein